MDVRLLRTFAAVVEHRSFTGAAAALGYTQSAVSQHISSLESSLGTRLFERRPFAMTPAAIRLAEHAASILRRVDVATSELAALEQRTVTVITATPFAGALPEVARLLARGHRMERSTTAELTVEMPDEVVTRVARGQCSVGVVDGIVGRSDPLALSDPGLLTAFTLHVSPLAVAMPDDHPFAARPSLGWGSVSDARWIDAPHLLFHAGPGAGQLLDRRWGRTRYGGTDPSILCNLVAAGHGLALVPVWWAPATPGVATVPLAEPALLHRVEVLVLRQRAHEWAPLVVP